MKKFQFSLGGVLNYKQQVLDGIQNEYAALVQQVRLQEERLRRVEAEYAGMNREFREQEAQGISIAEALRYENGLRYLEQKIRREEQTLAECRKRAENKRQQLIAARQDTASLEKLKEKKLEAYRKEEQKGEEQYIDEIVTTARLMAADGS